MKFAWLLISTFSLGGMPGMAAEVPIDRHALVSRHDLHGSDYEIPLGNGNFAFNADGTGLETFEGNTMSHWCWHSFPLPAGVTRADIKPWASPDHGHLTGNTTTPPAPIYDWSRSNPHPLNLGRIGFADRDGARLQPADVRFDSRHLDLWTGQLESRFTWQGQPVTVRTCVDPKSDTVAVRVVSPLLRDRRLKVLLDFSSPQGGRGPWLGDFSRDDGHRTIVESRKDGRLELKRVVDATEYEVVLTTNGEIAAPAALPKLEIKSARYGAEGGWLDVKEKIADLLRQSTQPIEASNALGADPAPQIPKRLEIDYLRDGAERHAVIPEGGTWDTGLGPAQHRFIVAARDGADALGFTCGFGPTAAAGAKASVPEIEAAGAKSWAAFWRSGGAIDLSGSKDPRWFELERRIVLSQYELAAQSAGDYPPAEVGLTGLDPWQGKWHFEMIWWHLAHYALWDRWPKAEKALTVYPRLAPLAREIAKNFDYRGLMWPKQVGPDGYNDGFPPEMALLWKEPHPIFFAELDYRLHPTPATLEKWKDIVLGTADFMADYPTKNAATGKYDLTPSWPASEGKHDNLLPHNTIFELAYWRAALEMAQQWRLRLGLKRDPRWDDVARNLAPLPVKDGLYIFSNERTDTFTLRRFDHLDNIGFVGMLPPFQGLDPAIALRTVREVSRDWQWDGVWGWDFPWLAMAAARVGESRLAVDALMNPSSKNHYDKRGLCTGGPPPYLPGNGGLLYAVAMMAAGWDGAPKRHAPGFPDDGSWNVRWEGLKPAP